MEKSDNFDQSWTYKIIKYIKYYVCLFQTLVSMSLFRRYSLAINFVELPSRGYFNPWTRAKKDMWKKYVSLCSVTYPKYISTEGECSYLLIRQFSNYLCARRFDVEQMILSLSLLEPADAISAVRTCWIFCNPGFDILFPLTSIFYPYDLVSIMFSPIVLVHS